MKTRYALAWLTLLGGTSGALAQELNSEITVTHEIVPEERAATRLRLLPQVSLPAVKAGRLPAASTFAPTQFTPYMNPLEAAGYLSTLTKTPWRGYAALGYGPVYSLAASAGYRFVDRDSLRVDGYLQFNGDSYVSKYPGLPFFYDGKVCFRRNTGLVGANTTWTARAGQLTAAVLYQLSDYNFPILVLDPQNPTTDHHQIDANQAKVLVGWKSNPGTISYGLNGEYDLMYFGNSSANNRGKLGGNVSWQASKVSSWGLDLSLALTNSSILGNKGIFHIEPFYGYTGRNLTAKVGLDIDVKTGNLYYYKRALVAPRLNIAWTPSTFFALWGQISGRMDDNFRGAIYDEQPYLMSDFDAGFSRLYDAKVGFTIGPWKGASIGIFGGYMTAKDWYMPAIETGYMASFPEVKGFYGGASFSYDYRRLLSIRAKAELADSPRGDYTRGYALWRDHAKFNLSASLTVRPIQPLEITIGYKLRTGREKTLGANLDLNLLKVNNLTASINYRLNDQWGIFLTGDNLANQKWYLGPAVPCRGISGLIGATCKF